MYCSKCGTENKDDSIFCKGCGSPNSVESTNEKASPKSSNSIPEIWNPDAAGNWSLLFTPAFGSFIQAQNWKELNQPSKATASMAWFFVSLLATIAFFMLSNTQYLLGFAFWYLIIWYVFSGRKQSKYVKETHGDAITKKGWGKPLALAFVIWLVLAFVILVVRAALGGQVPVAATSTPAKVQPQAEQVMNVMADSEKWSEARALCNTNYDDMVDFLLVTGKAMGSIPTEDELQELRNANPCDCVYKKVAYSTSELDDSEVLEDLIRIEELVMDDKMLQGNTPSEWEKKRLNQSNNFGVTVTTAWGVAMRLCTTEGQ